MPGALNNAPYEARFVEYTRREVYLVTIFQELLCDIVR